MRIQKLNAQPMTETEPEEYVLSNEIARNPHGGPGTPLGSLGYCRWQCQLVCQALDPPRLGQGFAPWPHAHKIRSDQGGRSGLSTALCLHKIPGSFHHAHGSSKRNIVHTTKCVVENPTILRISTKHDFPDQALRPE